MFIATSATAYESEPNDTPEQAELVESGAELLGALLSQTGEDQDYFAVDLAYPGILKLVSSDPTWIFGDILDASLDELHGAIAFEGASDQSFNLPASGRYYIRLYRSPNAVSGTPMYAIQLAIQYLPPDAPDLSVLEYSSQSVSLRVQAADEGSSAITGFETTCFIPDLNPQSRLGVAEPVFDLGAPLSEPNGRSLQGDPESPLGSPYSPTIDIDRAKVGDWIGFSAPEGARFLARITSAEESPWGNTVITAEGDAAMLAVVAADGNFFATIRTQSGDYYRAVVRDGQTLVYSAAAGDLAGDAFIDDVLEIGERFESPAQEEPLGRLSRQVVISVGVQYDAATGAAYDEVALIEHLFEVASKVYQSSDVNLRFEVVGIRQFDPSLSEQTLAFTLLDVICGNGGACNPSVQENQETSSWREEIGADILVQIVRFGTDSEVYGTNCGFAYPVSDFDDRDSLLVGTHNVTAVERPTGELCPDIVVAHEMGHNFGLFHDRQSLASSGSTAEPLLPYAWGYYKEGIFGTLMARVQVESQRIWQLSTPNLFYEGFPTGIPEGEPLAADAVLAVQKVMTRYEAIYDNAAFEAFPVTAEALSGGDVTPKLLPVRAGETASFNVYADQDYVIAGVEGCGGTLEGNLFTTGAVSGACTIKAKFSQYRWRQDGEAPNLVFSGLPSGKVFSCTAVAINEAGGRSAESESVSFRTQSPSAPSAPQIIFAEAGDGEIVLRVISSANGGASIFAYTVRCEGGGETVEANSADGLLTLSGLSNGISYQCAVFASNSVDDSEQTFVQGLLIPEEASAGLPIWLLYRASQ